MKLGTHYDIASLEHVLACGMMDVATDMRWIDVIELITFLRLDKHANIDSLFLTSCEGRFRPDTLKYCRSGQAFVAWGEEPSIQLDLMFSNLGITVFFRLSLGNEDASVHVDYLEVSDGSAFAGGEVRHLQKAIEDARLMPMSAQPAQVNLVGGVQLGAGLATKIVNK